MTERGRSKYDKTYYERNKTHLTAQMKDRKRKIRELIIAYKKTLSCGMCGEDDWVCLDFHHKDANNKEIAIAESYRRGWCIERIMLEISKCDVLCRNCHTKLHAGRFD